MVFASGTDRDWKTWGDIDPYFGVFTAPQFHRENLNENALEEFFLSGEKHVAHVLEVLRQRLHPGFTPSRILDFGCGAGRMAIPFAQHCDQVTGVDISTGMLKEAIRNADRKGLKNIRFLQSDQFDGLVSDKFDLVHTAIVLQHIPTKQGEKIFQNLLQRLEPEGLGAIHLTFSRDASRLRCFVSAVRKRSRIVHRIMNLLQSRPFSTPPMQMNAYSLNRIFMLLAAEGCGSIYSEFSRHGDMYGVMLYFQKIQLPML